MADSNVESMSDQDLMAIAGQAPQKPSGPSNQELLKAAGQNQAEPSYLEDVAKATGAGLARGAAQLVGLPGTMSDLFDAGITAAGKKIGVIPEDWVSPRSSLSGSAFESGLSDLTGGATEYRGQTMPGQVAGTVGEFLPGAVIGPAGGFASRLASAATAGAASELAGQAVSDSSSPWAEPAARLAGAILGGMGANKIENIARGIISPGGGADPARLAAAEALRRQKMFVTAGQATGRPGILAAEANTPAGQALAGAAADTPQARAFTAAAMSHLGVTSTLATPEAMQAARSGIVARMNAALADVDVPARGALSQKAADAAQFYLNNTPSSEKILLIKNILGAINRAAATNTAIPAQQLASWRSNLGEYLDYRNKGVRGTAFMLRDAIDEAIENSMRASGQADRVIAWRTSRDQYRNYLAFEDALKVTRASGLEGIITPKDLMAALAKQDKSGVVRGQRGSIETLARQGQAILNPLPEASPLPFMDRAVRVSGPLATAGAAGFGALQGAEYFGLNPYVSAALTAAAVGRPLYSGLKEGVRGMAMSPIAQKYLENQLVNPSTGVSGMAAGLRGAAYGAPSMLADERIGRKAGGRVGGHEQIADKLVAAAEHAKKGISKETAGLLDMPDDHVAHALEIANRSI